MDFRRHFLLYAVLLLIVLAAGYSYYRFMVADDYVVEYEVDCDPATQACFTGCDDDECTSTYAYALMQKRAPDIERECGVDITDCEAAQSCLEGDTGCSVSYCDPESDGECIGPNAAVSEDE